MKKEISIAYMVAGLSSRFGGKIKQFAKVGPNNETLIEYSLNQAISAGIKRIIFIVGEKTEKPFKEMFGNNYKNIQIEYALQSFNLETRDKPWGTVDALCSTIDIIKNPLIICNGDDIYGTKTFKALVDHLEDDKNEEEVTIGHNLIKMLPDSGKVNRGIFTTDENSYIKNIREVFDIEKSNLKATGNKPDDLCNMNLFVLHPKTISLLNSRLQEFKQQHKEDRKIECLLTTELSRLIEKGEIKMKLLPTVDRWFGITSPEDEEIVRQKLKDLKTSSS